MGSRFTARVRPQQSTTNTRFRLSPEYIREFVLSDETGGYAAQFLKDPEHWKSFDPTQLARFVEELVELVPTAALEATERGQLLRRRLGEFVAIRLRGLAESRLPKQEPALSEITLVERVATAHRLPLVTELPDQTVELDYRNVQYLIAAAALIGEYTADVEAIAQRLRLAADTCSVRLDGGQFTLDPFIARLTINEVLRQARECCGGDSPALVAVNRIVNRDLIQALHHRFKAIKIAA